MKKKNLIIIALTAVLILAISSIALAKDVTYTLKGTITAMDEVAGTITIYNETDGFVTVFLPEGYSGALAVGYGVSVKGIYGPEGFVADEVSVTSDILVGVVTGLPVLDPITSRYFIVVEIEGGVEVTVLLPDGYPIDTVLLGDTVRFKGSWADSVFDANADGACIQGVVTGGPAPYEDTGRYAITLDSGAVVLLPAGFDTSTVAVDDTVRACGTWVDTDEPPDGIPNYLDAVSVEVNPIDEPEDEIEPGGRGGIYCDKGKDKPHPLSVKISQMYADDGITPDWVMEQFCAGFGFGEIMLALRTQDFLGEDPMWDTRAILSMRNEMGWGQIWKALEISKSDKDGVPPPGQLMKPDKEDKVPPGQAKKLGNGTPPGLVNKPEKGKGPKK